LLNDLSESSDNIYAYMTGGKALIMKNDLKFNCYECTIMRVDESPPFPGFALNVTRIAPAFCGG
jgi:hypothetical protein